MTPTACHGWETHKEPTTDWLQRCHLCMEFHSVHFDFKTRPTWNVKPTSMFDICIRDRFSSLLVEIFPGSSIILTQVRDKVHKICLVVLARQSSSMLLAIFLVDSEGNRDWFMSGSIMERSGADDHFITLLQLQPVAILPKTSLSVFSLFRNTLRLNDG